MSTTVTAQQIARELQSAYDEGPEAAAQVMTRYLAEQVQIRHDPPSVTDGLVARDSMADHRNAEQAAFRRTLSDFTETARVSAAGESILVEIKFAGTLPDGTAVELTIPATYELEDGRIVRLTARVDPEASAALRAALAENGFVPRPLAS
jgi:hypothetical protein